MTKEWRPVTVIGGGLAGCEAAWQIARRGVPVVLYEMRPGRNTPAHQTDLLGELVCSNSLGSTLVGRAPGLLKAELEMVGSLVLDCAREAAVPAGRALAVDREALAQALTAHISAEPRITLLRSEVTALPEEGLCVVASGPLTSPDLAQSLARLTGSEHLSFYDAMAPIVQADSIDMEIAFRASRYDDGEGGDYINCPMSRDEYEAFVEALVSARRAPQREFERGDPHFFEACLPIEVLAARGKDALAYGPLRPVGLVDPRTGRRPYAVVQLRQDNLAGSLYNLVGFQTSLAWDEQRRVLSLIPGLQKAQWVRLGQMHRNTFIDSPRLLSRDLSFQGRSELFFAGQLIGTEGYVGSTASGLVAGINAARRAQGRDTLVWPEQTMLGALLRYVTTPQPGRFQPIKANLGLLPSLEIRARSKRQRGEAQAERALQAMRQYVSSSGVLEDVGGVA
ncbi:MAG: methylenetetrahydrofolate--tRNA-(uracil(54)-C(5))-methyltransferase (FADH(2)-oxidizing) TrmFO [Anaerolineae bacterium]|jgi:methylenetetrahydrofolate--tRNA-(uracil-5-)-methyltransferase|nr:methylenetetrahydrofolate--tRNA-(uracil(54)-C(5))-methyltransferase (FADH(2)-oxidizing) TrmFO [Chloroflexota bacterium]